MKGIAGNLAMSHNDLFCGVISGMGIHHASRTDAAPAGAAHTRDTRA